MLARTPKSLVYLSADELGITERERAGLIEVRDDLASGRVKHEPKVHWTPSFNKDPRATGFNMRNWTAFSDCGTAHCIGGFLLARGIYSIMSERSDSLEGLFIPDSDVMLSAITVEQAVRAIDHFLAGAANDCWPLALQDEPA
jgi:hypothetical protein